MASQMTTGGQIVEIGTWTNRLTLDQYQERRYWLRQLTDPSFNMEVLKNVLTPTTFGPEIKPPFDGAVLEQDGPGDDTLDTSKLKLVPILKEGDSQYITVEESVRRGQANPNYNWGQRLAFRLRDAGNEGKISKEIWPVDTYVICSKTVWRSSDGDRYVWCVFRSVDGFDCSCDWFSDDVGCSGRFPSQ